MSRSRIAFGLVALGTALGLAPTAQAQSAAVRRQERFVQLLLLQQNQAFRAEGRVVASQAQNLANLQRLVGQSANNPVQANRLRLQELRLIAAIDRNRGLFRSNLARINQLQATLNTSLIGLNSLAPGDPLVRQLQATAASRTNQVQAVNYIGTLTPSSPTLPLNVFGF